MLSFFAAEQNLADKISIFIGWIIVIAAVAVFVYLKRRGKKLDQAQSTMTAAETVHATLESTEKGQTLGNYHYILYYRADDGRLIRVSVSQEEFRELSRSVQVFDPRHVHNVRPSGMLTYQGSTLISFERDAAPTN